MRALAVALAVLVAGSCAPAEQSAMQAPAPDNPDPQIRIGVLVNVLSARIASDAPMRIIDPVEGELAALIPGSAIDVTTHGAQVSAADDAHRFERTSLRIESVDSGVSLRVNGREYRGVLEVQRGDSGLTVVNQVGLEQYLMGVVGSELGQRAPGEEAALQAQAIVSRTYALKNMGRWATHGFDLLGSVNDQVYVGEINENPMATAAVRATRGQIITYNGEPIDAFFSSTCGGRTEQGSAAFAGADRPYLQSVDDHDGNGVAWCAISPRYRWNASWSGAELSATLRRTLAAERLPADPATSLSEVRTVGTTSGGRVAAVQLAGSRGRLVVSGQAIRRVLSPPEGGLLRSNDFTIRLSHDGSRLERIDISGRGNGHGVGMCQWGAIGRSRAGQDYRTILNRYFPGTEIQRIY
jgi:stage II sporulation protein D